MVKKSSMSEMVADDRPSFFKIIFDDLCNEHLRIPPAFVKHLSNELSNGAILRGPSGDQWKVQLCKTIDGIYMKDGWVQFFKDHSLGQNEFLIFLYDRHMLFDVQIFDQSGCERYNVPIIRTFHEPGASASKRPRGRPRKLPLESLHSNKPKSCKYSPGENLPHRAPTKTNHGTEVAKSTQMKVKAQKTGLHKEKMKAHTKIKGEGTQRRVDIKPTQKPNTATSSSRQRPPTDEVGPKVWNDVESFTSKFPFINICLREANLGKVGLLPIRHEFARAHLPDFKTKITLRTCENRSWEVTYLCNKSYRMFSGGWTSFARENKLEIGNNCIFEVVAQDELRVHIFR